MQAERYPRVLNLNIQYNLTQSSGILKTSFDFNLSITGWTHTFTIHIMWSASMACYHEMPQSHLPQSSQLVLGHGTLTWIYYTRTQCVGSPQCQPPSWSMSSVLGTCWACELRYPSLWQHHWGGGWWWLEGNSWGNQWMNIPSFQMPPRVAPQDHKKGHKNPDYVQGIGGQHMHPG